MLPTLAIAHKMHVVQIGDLRHDLHLSIFPSLVSDRRSAPIINVRIMVGVSVRAGEYGHF